tara:strand:+ start:11281 stop:11457 length:177 start_codon:yes stop_codon:yes gene_type:complete
MILPPVPDAILDKVDEICAENQYQSGLIDGNRAAEIYAANPDFDACVLALVEEAKLVE